MAEEIIQVARLRGIIEVMGADEAAQSIRKMQREFDQAASGTQKAATGLAALDRHAKTAYERAQEAGKRFRELEEALDETAEAADEAAKNLNKTGDAADNSGKKASDSAKSQSLFSSVLGDVSAKSVLAGLGVAGLGLKTIDLAKDAAKTAIEYEQSFAGIRKTIDATESEYADLSRAVRDMATEIPVSAAEIASIAAAAGQLGIAKESIVSFTRTIADLGVATDLSGESAAMTLARFINITGTAQGEVGNLASGLVHLGNTTASTESQIMSMAMRLASAGKTVGFTDGQILGMAATLSSLGLEAEAGGNNMSMVLLEIDKAVDTTGDKLNILAEVAGMSAADFAAAWETAPDRAFQAFLSGLNQIEQEGGNTAVILDRLGFDGIRAGDAIRRAAGNTDLLKESMASASNAIREGNALTEEANQFYDTSANKLEIAKNKWDDLSITLGERFIPVGVEVATTLGDMALGIANVVEHLTSSRTLEAVEIWERLTAGARGGDIPMPEMPEEEPKGVWWISNWANTDWGDVWENFKAPDDVMNQFAELSANELFKPETREKLQGIIDDYGKLRPEMGGVTKEQRDLAEQVLYYIEQAEKALEVDAERARQGMLGSEDVEYRTEDFLKQIEVIERVAQAERDLEAARAAAPLIDRQSQYLADQEEQIGRVATAYRLSAPDIAELGNLFAANADMAADSVADIVQGVSNGSIAFRDAAQLYEGAVDEHVIAAIDKAREKFQEDLRRAILEGTDPTEAQTNLQVIEALFGDVTAATDEFISVQDRVNQNLENAADGLKHWEDSLKDVTDAIDMLLDIEERQGYLTAEQYQQYETLIWYQDRLTGGIENDMIPAYIDAQVKAAEFTRVQDELNRLLSDGKITEEQHAEALLDAALAADAGSLAAHGLAEAQQKTAEMIDKAIDRVEEFIVKLGLIPANVDSTVTVTIQTVGDFPQGFTEFEPTGPLAGSSLASAGNDSGHYHTGVDRKAEAEAEKSAAQAEREAAREAEKAARDAERAAEQAAREAEREAEAAAREAQRIAEETAKFQTSILSDLENRLDPDYIKGLQDELEALFDMRDFAIEHDLGEATVAKIEADIKAVENELALLGEVAGSDYGQGIIAGLEQADIAAAVTDMFTSIFSGAGDGEAMNEGIENLKKMIALGMAQGLDPEIISGWLEELAGLESDAAEYWQTAAAAAAAGLLEPDVLAEFAKAGGEQFRAYLEALVGEEAATALIDEATKLGAEVLSEVSAMFDPDSPQYAFRRDTKPKTYEKGLRSEDGSLVHDNYFDKPPPVKVPQFFEDLIEATAEGRMEVESLYDLIAQVPANDMFPILAKLGDEYHEAWIEAIIAGNTEAADSFAALLDVVNGAKEEFTSGALTSGGGGPKPMDPWEFFGMPKQTWIAAGMPIPGEVWDGEDQRFRQYTRDGLWQGKHGSASASTIAHAQAVKNEMLGIEPVQPEELMPSEEEFEQAGKDASNAYSKGLIAEDGSLVPDDYYGDAPDAAELAGADSGIAFAEAFTDAASGIDWEAILAGITGETADLKALVGADSSLADRVLTQVGAFDTTTATGLNLSPAIQEAQALDPDRIRQAVADGIREGIQGGGFDATFNISVGDQRLYSIVWDVMNRIYQEQI